MLCGLGRCAGESSLELIAQRGEFREIGFVGKRKTEAGIVVAELALGDGEILAGGGALPFVAADQAVEGVHYGTRAVRIAG